MNSSRCEELINPDPSTVNESYRTAMLALFIIVGIYTLFTLALFKKLQSKYHRLRVRSFSLLVLSSVSGYIGAWGTVAYREYIGRENYSCNALLSLVYLVIPNVAGPIVINLLNVYSKILLAKEANKLNIEKIYDANIENRGQVNNLKDIANAFIIRSSDLSSSTKQARSRQVDIISTDMNQVESNQENKGGENGTSNNGSVSRPVSMNNNRVSAKKGNMKLISTSFRYAKAIKQLENQESVNNNAKLPQDDLSLSLSGDSEGIYSRFFILKAKAGLTYSFVIYVAFLIPFLILIFAYGFTKPYYMDGCNGCRLRTLEMALLLIPSCIISIAGVIAMHRLRNKPDPLGIVQETYLAFLTTIILIVPSFTLILVDPGDIDKKGNWTWDLLLSLTLTNIHNIICPLQILISISAIKLAIKNVELTRILEIPEGRNLFMKHLIHEFSVENLKFWEEASSWRENFKENNEAVQHRATSIFKTFIGMSAPLAINIPHEVVREIEDTFKKLGGNVPQTVFDGALKEAFRLLDSDAYPRFAKTKEFKEFLMVHDFTSPSRTVSPTISALSIRSNKSIKKGTDLA